MANADDVVTALKCSGPRHMDRRHRLTDYLMTRLGDVRHPLPEELSPREQAYYLQGTFFNTAVVQMSEAMAHLLMVFAQHPDVRERVRKGDVRYLDHVMAETQRLYPLFGIAHRITTGPIEVDASTKIPSGSVLCFNYPEFHRSGCTDPDRFDPGRWARPGAARDANHIPFG
ncbi:cytochrome P450, partial [Actinomadura adrarensis]